MVLNFSTSNTCEKVQVANMIEIQLKLFDWTWNSYRSILSIIRLTGSSRGSELQAYRKHKKEIETADAEISILKVNVDFIVLILSCVATGLKFLFYG